MKRMTINLISGLMILGMTNAHAQGSSWFNYLNEKISNPVLENIKKHPYITGSVIGLGALCATAYGIYNTFFKDEFSEFRKNAVKGSFQKLVLDAFDADLATVGTALSPQLSRHMPTGQFEMDYSFAYSAQDTKAMKKIALGILRAAKKMNVV